MPTKVNNEASIQGASFHPIQILLVIAFLGLIAALVTQIVSGLLGAARLNAANAEADTIRTAALNYMAEHGKWPTEVAELSLYYHGTIDGKYDFI